MRVPEYQHMRAGSIEIYKPTKSPDKYRESQKRALRGTASSSVKLELEM
jgi:hypothetical protein